jgi:hypothetical protein
MTPSQEVVLDQYRMLRAEVMSLIDETRKIEVYALGGIGAFYAWLVSSTTAKDGLIWYLPTALAVFGGMRSLGLFVRLGDISRYMQDIEAKWSSLGLLDNGWETYFSKDERRWPKVPGFYKANKFPLSFVTTVFWGMLILGTLFAPSCLQQPPPTNQSGFQCEWISKGETIFKMEWLTNDKEDPLSKQSSGL